MIEMSVSELRTKTSSMQKGELLHILDGRAGKGVGYFIPESYASKIAFLIDEIEREQRIALLKRVAGVRKSDVVGEGGVGDGIV